jgi:hypothetical protein
MDAKKNPVKTEEKKIYKISLDIRSGGSSIIYRHDGFPFICDTTDNSVKWLHDKGYKEADIEIIGEKPAIWDSIFSPPVVAQEPEAVVPAPADPNAFVDKITNTASSPSE